MTRLSPREAAAAAAAGALLIDTRTEIQRREQGELPGALVIDRTVLEWRLDPGSPDRIPEATRPRLPRPHPGGARPRRADHRGLPPGLQLQPGRRQPAGPGPAPGHRHDR